MLFSTPFAKWEFKGKQAMRRLSASVQWDVVRQFRSGFYFASAFFALVWIAVFSSVPDGLIDLRFWLPPVLLLNLIAIGYYYVGALVLLEKGEGSLSAVTVSPLRSSEYLLAKVTSLTLLATAESLAIIVFIYGFNFQPLILLLSLLLLCAFYVLVGFAAVARYDSINTYLLPSILVVTFLSLPLVDYLGLLPSILFYLHPLRPLLTLLTAAFNPTLWPQLTYGLIGSFLWLAAAFIWSKRTFTTFIIQQANH